MRQFHGVVVYQDKGGDIVHPFLFKIINIY